MPLPIPAVPTRTWAELVEEGRALIARDAPDWTDHNLHDPGITLLELFAWLTEALLYRADRITPGTRRAFLRLVGVEPRPPGVAGTVVAIPAHGGAAAGDLPAGAVVSSGAGDVRFSTAAALWISPAWLELDAAEPTAHGALVRETDGALTDLGAANRGPHPFAPFGDAPRPGDALRIGFDQPPFAAKRAFALHVWSARWEREDADVPPPVCGDAVAAWEYWAGDHWRALESVTDSTHALARSGPVVLPAPGGHVRGPADARWWIRCRLVEGAYDCPPALARIAVNAVRLRHAVAAPADQLLGTSHGQAEQRHRLRAAPVIASSTRLRVELGDGSEDAPWSEVADWDRSGPYDRHYRLDPATGTVAFGDGRRGRVPPAGAELRVLAHETGGGAAGNVAAGTLTRIEGAPQGEVLQPAAARGGSAVETLDRAHGRALERLAATTRAVTAEDFERLALATPGRRVARAHALPGHHPALACVEAHGVVTVVILPACGDPPAPTPALLEAVRRHLRARRPLGTELHVAAPVYRDLTVEATLHVRKPAAPDLVARAEAALRAHFDPLHGGPAGSGWPFGRDVMETEVLAVLGSLPGVMHVDGLGLSGPGDAVPLCGNLPLCGAELVSLRPPRIVVVEEDVP